MKEDPMPKDYWRRARDRDIALRARFEFATSQLTSYDPPREVTLRGRGTRVAETRSNAVGAKISARSKAMKRDKAERPEEPKSREIDLSILRESLKELARNLHERKVL